MIRRSWNTVNSSVSLFSNICLEERKAVPSIRNRVSYTQPGHRYTSSESPAELAKEKNKGINTISFHDVYPTQTDEHFSTLAILKFRGPPPHNRKKPSPPTENRSAVEEIDFGHVCNRVCTIHFPAASANLSVWNCFFRCLFSRVGHFLEEPELPRRIFERRLFLFCGPSHGTRLVPGGVCPHLKTQRHWNKWSPALPLDF